MKKIITTGLAVLIYRLSINALKIFLIAAAIIPLNKTFAQQSTTNEQWAVQQTVKNIFDVLSNRDSTILKNYCTADVAFYEYGMVWNIDSMIQKAILQTLCYS